MKKIGVIIPAGGTGTRMGAGEGTGAYSDGNPTAPKQFLQLGGSPMLAWVIDAFRSVVRDGDIVVALPAAHIETWTALRLEHNVPPHKICEGGETRFESVRNAIRELDPDCEYIAVHDAARPLVSAGLILRTIETARKHGSAIPVVPLADSIRRLRGESEGLEGGSYSEERSTLRAVQTPQVFRADILRTGYERAAGDNFTDDAGVVESVGYNVMLCEGERRNFKITEQTDLIIADSLLNDRNEV